MSLADLIATLAARFPKSMATDAGIALKEILDAVAHSTTPDEQAEVRGSDSFGLTYRAQRAGRNPKTGETVSVLADDEPHFKPGKNLRERVEPSVGPENVRLAA